MSDLSNVESALIDTRDRIVRLMEERDGINSDIKDLVEEGARISGFSKNQIRRAATIEKKGREEYLAEQEMFEQLLRQLDMMAFED